MNTFIETTLGDIYSRLKPYMDQIQAELAGNSDPLIRAENLGYIQKRSVETSPIVDRIPLFLEKLRKHKGKDENQGDVNVVVLDGSISTDMDYASNRTDAPYRPPMSTEKNLMSMIQEKMHYKEQQYRRYDAMQEVTSSTPNFTEQVIGGTATTVIQDPAWDWQYGSPQPQAWRNRLTRILTGTNPALSFLFRNSYRRCDFLYSTDYVSSDVLTVNIAGGNGFVQVFDETDPTDSPEGTWKEANGFVFSSREDPGTEGAVRTASFTFDTSANDPTTTYRKSIYQKRLKFKRTNISSSRNIQIVSTDGGRICYWGIQYSTNDYMFNFINSARGSHNIESLRLFEEWDVDYWKPDFILYSCNTVNEMTSPAGGEAVADSPLTFSTRFKDYIEDLIAKTYEPEIFAFILFVNMGQKPVDNTGRVLSRTISGGLGSNAATLHDYYNHLSGTLETIVYPTGHPNEGFKIANANVFHEFMRYGILRAIDNSTSIFSELFGYTDSPGTAIVGKTGITGTALVGDGTHLNDMGANLAWRYLEKYFNLY